MTKWANLPGKATHLQIKPSVAACGRACAEYWTTDAEKYDCRQCRAAIQKASREKANVKSQRW